MAVLSKLYRLPLFLAALCCVVAAALAVQWYYGSKNEQQTRKQLKKPAASTIALAEPPEDNLLLDDQGKFEEIMSRPLFIKSRKPLPVKQGGGDIVETTAPQPMTELAAKFSGFIDVPGGKVALIKDIKTRKYHRLRKGEQVNDWTLTELYPDKVVFEQGDTVEELLLRTPKSRPGSGKTGRPHTARRQPTAPVRNQSKPTTSDRRQHLMKRIDRGKPRTASPEDSGW